jgi:ABC-type sugar transport system permease subunit
MMSRTKLVSVALLLALCLPTFLFGGGWVEDKDGKTVIHVMTAVLPDPVDISTYAQAEAAGVKRFKEAFPRIFKQRYRDRYRADPEKYGRHNWGNVEVQLHLPTGIKVEGVEGDLLQIAGGMAPDVLYVNFRKSDTYIRSGFLYPLDKPEDGYLTAMGQDELAFRINKKLWPVIKRKGPEGSTHTWAIPWGGALGKVLVYRKDLFDAHKIPYPTKDWTWDDLMAAARKVTNPAKGTYGLLLGRGAHESFHWITFLWSAGGEVMVYDEATDEWRCTFDSPEAAVALDFYTRLSAEKWIDAEGKTRRGYSSKDAGDSNLKWNRGQIAMKFDYVDERLLSRINPETTGMAPVPLGPTGIRGAELNSRMMGLFAEIKDPVVRDAAWEYMRFYDSKPATEIKTRLMIEGGFGRYINPKYLKMFGYPEIERLSPKGWAESFAIAIETGKPEPCGKNSNIAYDLMTLPIQKAEQLMLADKLPGDREERLAVLQGILKKANARANAEMIGIISPEARRIRRIVASIVLVAIVAAFFLVFRRIFRIFTPPTADGGDEPKGWTFGKRLVVSLLLLPAMLSILVWQYVPLLRGSAMAFYDYQLVLKSTFVGVDNFGDLLWNAQFWISIWNALRYSFLVLGCTFLPPIILAILLQEVPRGKILFRVIYYLPAVISGMVVVLLWKQFFEPSECGALNALALQIPAIGFITVGVLLFLLCLAFARRLLVHEMRLASAGFGVAGLLLFLGAASLANPILFPGGEAVAQSLLRIPGRLFATLPEANRWLTDPSTAMVACVIPMVWAGMGPGCLLYLAALKGIPDDFYEAADIDGASFIDKILFVVFPSLKALILINFVGAFIGSWYSATGTVLMMTGGIAGTEVVGLHIWKKAFTFLKFGPATAMAWVLGFMLIGFTVHQLKLLSRLEFKAAGSKDL